MPLRLRGKPLGLMIVRQQPTTFPVAHVLSKLKAGRRVMIEYLEVNEARRAAINIAYESLDAEDAPDSFKLAVFQIARPKAIRYGLEVVRGRRACARCLCDALYEVFGSFVCAHHRRAKTACPNCHPKPKKELTHEQHHSSPAAVLPRS